MGKSKGSVKHVQVKNNKMKVTMGKAKGKPCG